jgi:hypothetical protein
MINSFSSFSFDDILLVIWHIQIYNHHRYNISLKSTNNLNLIYKIFFIFHT